MLLLKGKINLFKEKEMKSEIIFKNYSTWRGRWGDEEGREIVIASSFENPANWPFTLKRYDIEFDEDTYEEIKTESASIKLSKELFQRIKRTIENNRALATCEEHIENSVRDGSCDEYTFSCDSFTRQIGGLSIYSCGYYEADEVPASKRTDNYTVYKAIKDIEDVLAQEGISLY